MQGSPTAIRSDFNSNISFALSRKEADFLSDENHVDKKSIL
jgi:hypothetical protein